MYELLHLSKEVDLPWRLRIKIATDIATGMAYLHRGGLIHRDLKTPNVMMSGKKGRVTAKVTDFGLSGLSTVMSGRAVANPVWLAPEILRNIDSADPTKIDVYSFGVILFEIASRTEFFGEISFMGVVEDKIVAGERPTIPADVPSVFAHLIVACWDGDPAKRPNFSKICDDLIEIKSALKRDGVISLDKTTEGNEAEDHHAHIDLRVSADSSDDEKKVRRTKSDGDVIVTKDSKI